MEISIARFLLAVVVSHIIHFVLIGLLYMNPFVAGLYKKFEKHPAMRQWDSQGKFMMSMFFLSLLEIVFVGLIYISIVQVLPNDFWLKGIVFGLLLAGVRVYSRFLSMFLQTSYPAKLLAVEFVNGLIGCVIIGLGFSYFF